MRNNAKIRILRRQRSYHNIGTYIVNTNTMISFFARRIHKSVGFTKNCFDLFNVSLTVCIGLISTGHLIGIGIGTVLSMIGVGRVIAVFNHFTKDKLVKAAGVEI